MDFLSGSGLILLVCLLVGLGILVGRRRADSVTSLGAEKFVADIVESHASEAESSHLPPSPQTQVMAASTPTFRLKPGRITLFGLALICALTGLITGGLALWGKTSALPPLLFLLASLVCLVSLRVLALRDRDRRRARTLLALEQGQAQKHHPATQKFNPASAHRPVLASSAASSLELKPAPERPARARQQMPVSHAAKALRKAKTQHHPVAVAPAPVPENEPLTQHAPARLRMDEALPDTSWQVTELPLPTYLEAQAVRRVAPAPIELETKPQSQTQTLAEAAKLNLDDVLKRRRA